MKKSIIIIIFLLITVFIIAGDLPERKIKSLVLEYDRSAISAPANSQLDYFLQIPQWVEKINNTAQPGNKLTIYRRRISRILKQAAAVAEADQKTYLSALADDVKANNFKSSTALWVEYERPEVDIILLSSDSRDKKNLEFHILIKNKEFSEKAKQYSKILDKMLENIPKNQGAIAIEPGRISPISVLDIAYSTNPDRYTMLYPKTATLETKFRNRVLVFRNLLQARFDHIILPTAEKVLGNKKMMLVTFNSYLSNIIMHRLNHFTGPIFLEGQSEKVLTVKDELKKFFHSIEEIRADTAAIHNAKVLEVEKLIEKEELKNIAHTYVVTLLTELKFNPKSPRKEPALLIFNYLFKNDAILLDINTKKIRIQIEKFGSTVKKLLAKVSQIESQGNYAEAGLLMGKEKLTSPSDELKMIRKNLKKIPVQIKITGFKEKAR